MENTRIKDIAQMANVSPATVSIVLNNRRGVSPETRERVSNLLRQHGYRIAAGNEKLKDQGNIWFVQYKDAGSVIDGCEAFFSDVLNAIESEARRQGYKLSVATMTKGNKEELLDTIARDPMDGMILLGTELQSAEVASFLELPIPVVSVDNAFDCQDIDCVLMNNTEIAYHAVRHLYESGHTKIGHIKSAVHTNNFTARRAGFLSALEAFSLEFKPAFEFEAVPNSTYAYESIKKKLEGMNELPTAVFADSDTLAIGAMKAFREMGLRVPEDMSVVGFDDVPFASMTEPPLTTMKVNREQLGKLAVGRLLEKIRQQDDEVVKTMIGAKLICRGSVYAIRK